MPKREAFERYAKLVAGWFNWVAIVAAGGMLCVSVVDIVGCKLLRWPIPGSVDIIGLLLLLIAAFAIAQAEVLRRHIRVDFLIRRLPERLQGVFGAVSSFLSLGLFALVILATIKYMVNLQITGTGTSTLVIPLFPFAFAIALACIPVLLVFLGELFESVRRTRKK